MKIENVDIAKDHWWNNLRGLPYFRAFVRTVEAGFYDNFEFKSPILDLGCGDGNFAKATFDFQIDTGVDPWDTQIKIAQKTRAYKILIQSEGARLPFPEGYFHTAFSNSVLEHIPSIHPVLKEVNRVLKPGAHFYFCVPNPNYLTELDIPKKLSRLGLSKWGKSYTVWFKKISRVSHAEPVEVWKEWIMDAGFSLENTWNYFSPDDLRILEWGHYFGLPSLISKFLFKKWILMPFHWNLFIIEKILRERTQPIRDPKGIFSFYIVKKNI